MRGFSVSDGLFLAVLQVEVVFSEVRDQDSESACLLVNSHQTTVVLHTDLFYSLLVDVFVCLEGDPAGSIELLPQGWSGTSCLVYFNFTVLHPESPSKRVLQRRYV